MGRQIPIIADEYVDRAFGTGVVKVTPAHDQNDYAVGQRHSLPMICVLDAGLPSHQRPTRPEEYRRPGPLRRPARPSWPTWRPLGLLVEIKKHKLMVPRCARTGQVIEPLLTDQWFVAMTPSGGTRPATIAKKPSTPWHSGQVQFVPENWVNTYNQWMNNIQDWCISRQLWWGHQIPAWYDEDGNVYVATDEDEAEAPGPGPRQHACAATTRRADTWYSSAPGALLAPWAGPSRPMPPMTTSTSTCPPRCWSPATTSSSSGWPA